MEKVVGTPRKAMHDDGLVRIPFRCACDNDALEIQAKVCNSRSLSCSVYVFFSLVVSRNWKLCFRYIGTIYSAAEGIWPHSVLCEQRLTDTRQISIDVEIWWWASKNSTTLAGHGNRAPEPHAFWCRIIELIMHESVCSSRNFSISSKVALKLQTEALCLPRLPRKIAINQLFNKRPCRQTHLILAIKQF